MGRNGERPTPQKPAPQLARIYYTIDSNSNADSDSSDNSSLEILSPIERKTSAKENFEERTGTVMNCRIGSNDNVDPTIPAKNTILAAAASVPKLPKETKTIFGSTGLTNCSISFDIGSDTDGDDDDDLFLFRSERVFEKSKHPQRNISGGKLKQRKEDDAKRRKKREREQQKAKEKQDRIQKRKEEREEKERQKQGEKMKRKKQTEQHNQAMGKYSHQEIAVLLDTDLYLEDPYGLVKALSVDFLPHLYQNNRKAESLASPALAIQFVRKDKLFGGAKDAVACLESESGRGGGDKKRGVDNNNGFEHIQYLVLLFEPDDFISLLRRDFQGEEDDYPALESWLDDVRSRWRRAWSFSSVNPKIILLLVDLPGALDKKWIEYRRHNRTKTSRFESSLPTVKELEDAMQWVLVQFQVECIPCPSTELLQSTVLKLTRCLAERRYKNEVTELECVKKIKQGCTGSNDPLEKAKDVWLRQLQQLPGVSEIKAQHISEHFPTCQSLWQAYQWEHYRQQQQQKDEEGDQQAGPNENDADDSCSSLLDYRFSTDGKRYKKLSDSLYRVMTSDDPNEMIL